jgi:starvation-inducible DNA-binding protein
MDNQVLAEKLKVVLATAHSFALKAQNYHWNVSGPHFLEYHEFFQEIYEQIHTDIDVYAEFIRILGMFAPGSLSRFAEMTRIKDETTFPVAKVMLSRLAEGNMIMVDLLKSLHSAATEGKVFALTSFVEERLQYHEKLGWMLDSLLTS